MRMPLPLPEHDFPAADLQREAVAEHMRAQVRIGVHAIAVGVRRIVVAPGGVAGDDGLEERPDVGEERVWNSLMNTVHVVCIEKRLTTPSRMPQAHARAPSPVR